MWKELGRLVLHASGWQGYQCGKCGEEFKTVTELNSHMMAKHPPCNPSTGSRSSTWS